jgi:CheY-like chemotaxis protein
MPKQPYIFVVEEDPSVRGAVTRALLRAGYLVSAASSPPDAAALYCQGAFDLVLLGAGGRQALDALRRVGTCPEEVHQLPHPLSVEDVLAEVSRLTSP